MPTQFWTSRDDARLAKLAAKGVSAVEIGHELCRSTSAVRKRAKRLQVKLASEARGLGVLKRERPPSETTTAFKVGDRVRLSALGRSRHPRMLDVPGTVVSGSKLPNSVGVVFDQHQSITVLHKSYVEAIEMASEAKPQ